MKSYCCMTCQEPLTVSLGFHSHIRLHGPAQQKCSACGAVHTIDGQMRVTLSIPGAVAARLSMVYPYPEYRPYRVGSYRVQYANGNWARSYFHWDGDEFRNGPVILHAGSIVAWQGLGGDMEHLKRMPYDHSAPLPEQGYYSDDDA